MDALGVSKGSAANKSTFGHREHEGKRETPSKAWGMLAVVYLASFVAPLAQFKIPPLASWIIPDFGLDAVSFGMLMGVIGIVGLVLAFPAAYICRWLGAKKTVLLAVACLAIGSFVGACSSTFELLVASRLLEGVGLGLVGVVGPTCISVWFPEKTRGIALGLWATWVPLSMVLIYSIAPTMADVWSWRSIFVFVGCACVLAFILFALFFRMPQGRSGDFAAAGSPKDTLALLKNGRIWILGTVMFIFMFINTGALATYYNTFLVAVHGYSDASAGMMVSVFTAVGILSGPLAGAVSDRFAPDKKRFMVTGTYVLYTIGLLVAWPEAGGNANYSIWAFVVLGGFAAGTGTGTIRPLAPIVAGGGAMGAAISMAVIQFAQNLGAALGSPIFGWGFEAMGWTQASLTILVPLCFVAMVLTIFVVPPQKKGGDALP